MLDCHEMVQRAQASISLVAVTPLSVQTVSMDATFYDPCAVDAIQQQVQRRVGGIGQARSRGGLCVLPQVRKAVALAHPSIDVKVSTWAPPS